MKKIALALCAALLLTMVFGVFASAVDAPAGEAVVYGELFGLTEEDGDITYTGTVDGDGYPEDEFGVAVTIQTGNVGFCLYKIQLNWDPNVIEYVECADPAEGDIFEMHAAIGSLSGGFTAYNENDVTDGQFIGVRAAGLNYATGSGSRRKECYNATMFYVYFKPVSDAPANANITITVVEIKDQNKNLLPSTAQNVTFTINGGAAERTEPLESLGAQINASKNAIRFGADFYNLSGAPAVEDLGMLVVSEYRLGSDELTATLANSYVAKVQAFGVLNYVDGLKLADYEYVRYVAAIYNIPSSHLGDNIVARPYVKYEGQADYVYSDAMTRNYNEVAAATDFE